MGDCCSLFNTTIANLPLITSLMRATNIHPSILGKGRANDQVYRRNTSMLDTTRAPHNGLGVSQVTRAALLHSPSIYLLLRKATAMHQTVPFLMHCITAARVCRQFQPQQSTALEQANDATETVGESSFLIYNVNLYLTPLPVPLLACHCRVATIRSGVGQSCLLRYKDMSLKLKAVMHCNLS